MKILRATAIFAGLLASTTSSFASCVDRAKGDYPEKAAALMESYVKANEFTGMVLIACAGKPIFEQGFGMANREWNVPNAPDTKFRLGSLTKIFTATAILQLAEQGKLSIDDPVSKYYAASPAIWRNITIKHLLIHRSGIPDYADALLWSAATARTEARIDLSPEALIGLFRDKPLQFEPGSQFSYSNSGYVVLGVIIEKLSGEAYAGYVRKHILDLAGMHDSGYDLSDEIIARRAAGYVRTDGDWQNAPFLAMSIPYSAGSLYSTVDDLLRLDQAFYALKPLNAASQKVMFTNYGNHWGMGWNIFRQSGHDQIANEGDVNGFRTGFARYPDDKLTIIVLSNLEGAPIEDIFADLKLLYLGIPK
jgi:D-alanyl-D-alanine carboxypeptidase